MPKEHQMMHSLMLTVMEMWTAGLIHCRYSDLV